MFSELGMEGQASGSGSLFRIHFRANELTDHRSAYPTKAQEEAIRRLMVSANCSGNVLTAVSDADIDRFLTVTRESLIAVRDEKANAAGSVG